MLLIFTGLTDGNFGFKGDDILGVLKEFFQKGWVISTLAPLGRLHSASAMPLE